MVIFSTKNNDKFSSNFKLFLANVQPSKTFKILVGRSAKNPTCQALHSLFFGSFTGQQCKKVSIRPMYTVNFSKHVWPYFDIMHERVDRNYEYKSMRLLIQSSKI